MEKYISNKNILVIEDEVDLLHFIEDSLHMFGASVLKANSAELALELLKKSEIHLIISDIRMPGGGGGLLLNELRKGKSASPPILLITGFSDLSPEKAYAKGADGFLFKPFGLQTLIDSVGKILMPQELKWQPRTDSLMAEVEIFREIPSIDSKAVQNLVKFGRGGFFIRLTGDLPVPDELAKFKFRFTEPPSRTNHKPASTELSGYAICRWVRDRDEILDDGEHCYRGAGFEILQLDSTWRQVWLDILPHLEGASYIPQSCD